MSKYNPNPFDFVPLPSEPWLYEREYLDKMGAKVSGYLEVDMKTLTPVHIVGSLQRSHGKARSAMVQQDGTYMIPAASIRGMLRAFIEALTGGWLSQVNETYAKDYRKRHVGFNLFEKYRDRNGRISPPAVNPAFCPPRRPSDLLDIASYLFGIVTEPEEKDAEPLVLKSRVWVEDALIDANDLVQNQYWVPDIASEEAFMGGAHPSASNWWYFEPAEIWKRSVHHLELAEFVGRKLRGRKFYYHQNPVGTMRYYAPGGEWAYPDGFQRVWLEAMEAGTTTQTFRIYVDRIPMKLVALLELALTPGKTIRHKLGYGKAYGYGSVAFSVKRSHLRTVMRGTLPNSLDVYQFKLNDWNKKLVTDLHLDDLIDKNALKWLARVLGWEDNSPLLFTYPRYASGEFKTPVKWRDFQNKVSKVMKVTGSVSVNAKQAWRVAEALFDIKKPIHFRYYQEHGKGWDIIANRKP